MRCLSQCSSLTVRERDFFSPRLVERSFFEVGRDARSKPNLLEPHDIKELKIEFIPDNETWQAFCADA